MPKSVGNLDKIIITTGFEKLPKVQWIPQSGHTVSGCCLIYGFGTRESSKTRRRYFEMRRYFVRVTIPQVTPFRLCNDTLSDDTSCDDASGDDLLYDDTLCIEVMTFCLKSPNVMTL